MDVIQRNLNIDLAIHEISMECAKIQLQDIIATKKEEFQDISKCLDYLLESYLFNFKHLAQKTDEDIKTLLEID